MYFRFKERIAVLLIAIALFVSGIYYKEVATALLNEGAVIGLQFVVIFCLCIFAFHQKFKYVRMKYANNEEINKLQKENYSLYDSIRELKSKLQKRKGKKF